MVALLLLILGLALVAALTVAVWRRVQHSRHHERLAHRLRQRFPAVDEPLGDAFPLRSPPGAVAVRDDGLHLRIDEAHIEHCRVPWSDVGSVLPVGEGRVQVHIAGVGDLAVSGMAGHQLWKAIQNARTGGRRSVPA